MPEGFSSVADLRVIVDANADKFHSSLKDVRGALKGLQGEGGESLGFIDKALELVGQASVGASGKVKMVLAAVEAGVAIYKQFATEGRAVAESLGVTAEYDAMIETINDLGMSIKDGAVASFFALEAAAEASSGEMLGFANSANVAEGSADNFAATLITKVTTALDRVRIAVRMWSSDTETSGAEMSKTLEGVNREIDRISATIAKMESGEETRFVASAIGRIDMMQKAIEQLRYYEEQREKIIARRVTLPGQDWIDGTETTNSLLGDQIKRLEDQRAAFGLGTAAAAAYAAEQTAIAQILAKGQPISETQLRLISEQAREVGALTAAIEGQKTAEAERKAEEQRALQAGRAQDNTFAGADREINNLRARAEAFGRTAEEASRLAFEERLLQQLRATGATISDAEVIKVRALGEEYQRYAEQIRDSQTEIAQFGQVGQALSQGLGNAFSQWTRGAELNVETMVANMIAQLAQLAFQASVLEPLFGGGRTQGSGLVGETLGSIFGGFRENGGPVEAGRAYIVGERRPELFIPNSSGRIEPSVGGGGQPIQIVTNIDARGATPDAVQELRAAMAARDAALPNQVLAVVREGRERGVA